MDGWYNILMTIAPIMVYEFAQSLEKMGINNKKELFNPGMDKLVQKERENILKRKIVSSSQPKLIEKEMGLNFKQKVYDINIIVIGNELVDMNYELFNRDFKKEFDFWDSLFGVPQSILNALLMVLGLNEKAEDFYGKIDDKLNVLASQVDQKIDCQRYSYSVSKFFSHANELEDI